MATPAAGSGAGCSEPPGRLDCTLVDAARNAAVRVAVPRPAGRAPTLGDLLAHYRSADSETKVAGGQEQPRDLLGRRRFADALFLLTDDGSLGEVIPGLRFRIGGRACGPDQRLGETGTPPGPVRIEVDRSHTGYTRNWPAYLSRRWKLRADAYAPFVESVVEGACGREAGSVLRLDTPGRIRRFLAAVAARVHASPYETYSRYLEPGVPFKSCDQALDRILEGDGGNCAEKAMALYFIARAYGVEAEVVLGGEEAAAEFPRRSLRAVLDRRLFHDRGTRDAQRYWQHYAVLGRLSETAGDHVLCDVAGSNIPFLFLDAGKAAAFLGPGRKAPVRVRITLEPIRLYYHRVAACQDIPLDLYYAMETFIESIDLIQTVDNELGLLHTGDYWVGAVASRDRREFGRIVGEYERFVRRAGLDPRTDLCFTRDLGAAGHPLVGRFLTAHPREAGRVIAADAGLRQRIGAANPHFETRYVILDLRKSSVRGAQVVPAIGLVQ